MDGKMMEPTSEDAERDELRDGGNMWSKFKANDGEIKGKKIGKVIMAWNEDLDGNRKGKIANNGKINRKKKREKNHEVATNLATPRAGGVNRQQLKALARNDERLSHKTREVTDSIQNMRWISNKNYVVNW